MASISPVHPSKRFLSSLRIEDSKTTTSIRGRDQLRTSGNIIQQEYFVNIFLKSHLSSSAGRDDVANINSFIKAVFHLTSLLKVLMTPEKRNRQTRQHLKGSTHQS